MVRHADPVVLTNRLSLDLVFWYAQSSILHPCYSWAFSLGLCLVTGKKILMVAQLFLTATYMLAYMNRHYNRGNPQGNKDSKTILITGGSRGLGSFIVRNCLEFLNIDEIIILDIIAPEHQSEKVFFYECDISNSVMLDKTMSKVIRRHNTINVYINNAGVRESGPMTQSSQGQVEKVFTVNTLSYIYMIQKLVPQKNMHIIALSSILGTIGPKNLSLYSASKAALIQLHESASFELTDAVFSLILPGQINTGMFNDVEVPNQFLAPVIDANKLSLRIVDMIRFKERGVFYFPFYARFIPMMRCLPSLIARPLRAYSQMDMQISEPDDFILVD